MRRRRRGSCARRVRVRAVRGVRCIRCSAWCWIRRSARGSRKPKMNAKLRRRLDLLERNTQVNRTTATEAIAAAALSAISDDDLEQLHQFAERGVPFSECTPEEK